MDEMNRLIEVTFTVTAGIALTLVALEVSKNEAGRKIGEQQFIRATSWDYDIVNHCLTSGNGRHIFQDYERVSMAIGRGPPSPLDADTYLDSGGSSLVIERSNGKTEVRFKSARPVSDQQRDLLMWCTANPQLTWIAPEFRSKL